MNDSELTETLTKAITKFSEDGADLFLLTNVGCPGCEEAKMILKDAIAQKLITVADLQESDEAVQLSATLEVFEVPHIVAKYPDKLCLLDDEGNVSKCVKT